MISKSYLDSKITGYKYTFHGLIGTNITASSERCRRRLACLTRLAKPADGPRPHIPSGVTATAEALDTAKKTGATIPMTATFDKHSWNGFTVWN